MLLPAHRFVVRALEDFYRLRPRSRARMRRAQSVKITGRLLIRRFNSLLKFADCFRESPLIGQNTSQMIVRQPQARPSRQRAPIKRRGTVPGPCGFNNRAQTIQRLSMARIVIDGRLKRRPRLGESFGCKAIARR
jgi:hypothetical protein